LLCRVRSAILPSDNQTPDGREGLVAKKYRVTLTDEERGGLEAMISRGRADARKLAHARILLQADEADGAPARTDQEVAEATDVSTRTVERVRRRFVEEGTEAALLPRTTKRIYARALDGAQEAHLIALACSAPPEGKRRWALRLPAERVVELGYAESVSHETVRRTLQKTS
jgi:transposase